MTAGASFNCRHIVQASKPPTRVGRASSPTPLAIAIVVAVWRTGVLVVYCRRVTAWGFSLFRNWRRAPQPVQGPRRCHSPLLLPWRRLPACGCCLAEGPHGLGLAQHDRCHPAHVVACRNAEAGASDSEKLSSRRKPHPTVQLFPSEKIRRYRPTTNNILACQCPFSMPLRSAVSRPPADNPNSHP